MSQSWISIAVIYKNSKSRAKFFRLCLELCFLGSGSAKTKATTLSISNFLMVKKWCRTKCGGVIGRCKRQPWVAQDEHRAGQRLEGYCKWFRKNRERDWKSSTLNDRGRRQILAAWLRSADGESFSVHPGNCNLLELTGMFAETHWQWGVQMANPAVGKG